MTKEEVLKLIDETHQDFVDCQGGHTRFIFEDKIYETDTGYAMDGIEAFVERLKKKLTDRGFPQ